MAKPLGEQLKAARKRAGLKQQDLGPMIGWAQHTNVSKVERGRNTDSKDLVRWAEACGHEVLIVPVGSPDSLRARLDEAEERERLLATRLLDLLSEARAAGVGDRMAALVSEDLDEWARRLERRAAADAL